MVIKKSIQCPECRKYIDFYIEERVSLRGKKVKCNCGHQMECISDNGIISKWR